LKFDFRWGSAPDPARGAQSAPHRRPSYISGGLLLRGEMWKREEKGEERKRGKGRCQPHEYYGLEPALVD